MNNYAIVILHNYSQIFIKLQREYLAIMVIIEFVAEQTAEEMKQLNA